MVIIEFILVPFELRRKVSGYFNKLKYAAREGLYPWRERWFLVLVGLLFLSVLEFSYVVGNLQARSRRVFSVTVTSPQMVVL